MTTTRTIDTDVAIVGGGIMGASAALALRRKGVGVVLLERDLCGSRSSGVAAKASRSMGRELAMSAKYYFAAQNAKWPQTPSCPQFQKSRGPHFAGRPAASERSLPLCARSAP